MVPGGSRGAILVDAAILMCRAKAVRCQPPGKAPDEPVGALDVSDLGGDLQVRRVDAVAVTKQAADVVDRPAVTVAYLLPVVGHDPWRPDPRRAHRAV